MGHSGSKNGCLSLWPARAWNRLYIRLEWVTATNKVFLVIAHFSSSLCCCNQTYGSSLTPPPLLLFQFMTWIRYQQFARFGIWQARLKSCRDLDNATAEHYTILSTSAFQTSPVLISGNSGVDFKMLWICKEPGDIAKVVTWQHIYFLPICDATHPAQWLAGELQQYLVSLLDSGCKASKQSAHTHTHTHKEKLLFPLLSLWQLGLQFLEASLLTANWIMQWGFYLFAVVGGQEVCFFCKTILFQFPPSDTTTFLLSMSSV